MRGISLTAEKLERPAVVKETLRIFEVCDGCRRCFNLCPSFNTLFDRIDAGDSDLGKLATRDFEQVADECYYCKLCYNHCPYTPPHQYEIDFPRLMVGWKKLQAQEGKARWRDRLLVRTDWIGKLGALVAPLANWANAQSWFRGILHRIVGIHRDRQLVRFQEETFPHWLQRTRDDRRRGLYVGRQAEVGAGGESAGPPPAAKVVLFSTCLVDYHSVEVGQATVAVL